MTEHPDLVDLAVIGAGPTGLFGAFYAGMREMRVRIHDALEGPGGQITALYPDKYIYDTPGFPRVRGSELVENLVTQADEYGPEWRLGEAVQRLNRVPNPVEGEPTSHLWELETARGRYLSRTVLVAAGVGAFEPRRLGNEQVESYEGHGLYYFARNFEEFRGRRLLIVGGGDSAVDWATHLRAYAETTTLIHRRDRFRAHPAAVTALLEDDGVDVRLHHELRRLEGNDGVQGATIFDNRTDEETDLDVDAVILALGFKADLGPIKEWGLELSGRRRIAVNSRMETNLPGVFAAGDLVDPPDVEQLNLIVIGYAQATLAVNYAYVHIHPDAKLFPGHSSERDS